MTQTEKSEPHFQLEMKKEQIEMTDGGRYLIFYTFEKAEEISQESEDSENV